MQKAHSKGQGHVCPGLIKPSLGTNAGTRVVMQLIHPFCLFLKVERLYTAVSYLQHTIVHCLNIYCCKCLGHSRETRYHTMVIFLMLQERLPMHDVLVLNTDKEIKLFTDCEPQHDSISRQLQIRTNNESFRSTTSSTSSASTTYVLVKWSRTRFKFVFHFRAPMWWARHYADVIKSSWSEKTWRTTFFTLILSCAPKMCWRMENFSLLWRKTNGQRPNFRIGNLRDSA